MRLTEDFYVDDWNKAYNPSLAVISLTVVVTFVKALRNYPERNNPERNNSERNNPEQM
jgi:hypothetical protein